MTASADHDSSTATRILAAARELVLRRGVRGLTVAEIAERAHVGKGTAYLYWSTKEDLLLGLLARDFLAVIDEEIDALTADPDQARPHRLCPRVIRNALNHPFVRALQVGDADLLGVLADHPQSRKLLDMLGPITLMNTTLPVWRRHRLARTDRPLNEQTYALDALMAGFIQVTSGTVVSTRITVEDPDAVIAATVTTLLGQEHAGPAEVRAAAREGLQLLSESRSAVLALITTNHEPKR